MTKVFFNNNLIKDNICVPFLAPLLPDNCDYWWYNDKNQLDMRKIHGAKFIEFSDINRCDFVVFPINYKIDVFWLLKETAAYANMYKKKVIVFYNTDIEMEIPCLGNIIVYRTSLTKKSPVYENPLPTFIPDIYQEGIINNKNEITIWYTWYGSNSLNFYVSLLEKLRNKKFFKSIISFLFNKLDIKRLIPDSFCLEPSRKWDRLAFLLLQKWKQYFYRWKVINKLRESKYKFSYIERNKILNPSIQGELRKEYIDNVYKSTFTLVVRWCWNHAYRLYETMSAWRIPLFIDTDSRIPFDDKIDYKSLFLWIPFNDLDNIDSYIYKFLSEHRNHLDDIETKIRNTYLEYFRMNTYFPRLLKEILSKI